MEQRYASGTQRTTTPCHTNSVRFCSHNMSYSSAIKHINQDMFDGVNRPSQFAIRSESTDEVWVLSVCRIHYTNIQSFINCLVNQFPVHRRQTISRQESTTKNTWYINKWTLWSMKHRCCDFILTKLDNSFDLLNFDPYQRALPRISTTTVPLNTTICIRQKSLIYRIFYIFLPKLGHHSGSN